MFVKFLLKLVLDKSEIIPSQERAVTLRIYNPQKNVL